MKKFATLVLATLLLAGCSSTAETKTETGTGGTMATYVVDLPDGGSVLCVVYGAGHKGGLSCDWDGATK